MPNEIAQGTQRKCAQAGKQSHGTQSPNPSADEQGDWHNAQSRNVERTSHLKASRFRRQSFKTRFEASIERSMMRNNRVALFCASTLRRFE